MDFSLLLSFLGAAVVLTLMPGPDNLFVLAQSISQNRQAGIATSLGLCSGLLVHITATAAGISAILYQSSIAFAVVKYLGAAYLLYLAYQAIKDRETTAAIHKQRSRPYASLYRKGIIMNILNPKVSLFFLALLPQFVNQEVGSPALQMVLLGLIFIIQALVIFSIISIFAGKISKVVNKSTTISRKINLVKGALLALIGVQIAFSGK
ncbi:LysE family translocator [Pseudalkalibacillus hwajinpoensis]|uniref:LysE family translocator n=1 Tax=Guptibacillus hwajinpoensis TaxID=208199 RepID=UPI00325B8B99